MQPLAARAAGLYSTAGDCRLWQDCFACSSLWLKAKVSRSCSSSAYSPSVVHAGHMPCWVSCSSRPQAGHCWGWGCSQAAAAVVRCVVQVSCSCSSSVHIPAVTRAWHMPCWVSSSAELVRSCSQVNWAAGNLLLLLYLGSIIMPGIALRRLCCGEHVLQHVLGCQHVDGQRGA